MFTSIEGAEAALNGVYDAMQSADYYGRLVYAYEAAKGPDFWIENSGNRFIVENGWEESSTSGGYNTSAWGQIYSTIFLANNLLANIDVLQDEDATALNRIKGQALAIRALGYFDLMRLFAYPPKYSVQGKSSYNDKYKWGVPLFLSQQDHVDAVYNAPTRNTADEVYTQILVDLSDAASALNGISVEDGRMNYEAAKGLEGRVNLYLENWSAVIAPSLEAIGNYSMISYDDYPYEYFKDYNSEKIFELAYSPTDDIGSDSWNYMLRYPTVNDPTSPDDGKVVERTGYAGYAGNIYLRELLREERWEDDSYRDAREYLICDNQNGEDTGIRKYVGAELHQTTNMPIIRVPEVYLNLAEAYLMDNDIDNAVKYLNEITGARLKMDYSTDGKTKDDILTDILKERRKELVAEGHTYWDFFRRGISMVREGKGAVNQSSVNINFPGDYQCVYPIPENEMERNKNIRSQQNPGYDPYTGE